MPGRHVGDGLRDRGDVVRADAAAAPDDLRALGPPGAREGGVGVRIDRVVELPGARAEAPEVRVHAERHARVVAQPGQHPGDVVDRQAVDQQRADAHVLEAARGAAEGVALRRAPVLAEDAADAVQAAPEGEPHREAGLLQQLDGLERLRVADQGQRLEQQQVGRLLLEDPREQLDRASPPRRVRLLRDGERDRALAGPAGLLDRLAGEPHPQPRDVEPLRAAARARPVAHLELGGGEDRPGVRRDHVAARRDVRAVHVEHGLRRPVERPRAPELGVGVGVPLQLRRHAAVEDDAAVRCDQVLEPGVRAGAHGGAAGTGGLRHRREYEVRDGQSHGPRPR